MHMNPNQLDADGIVSGKLVHEGDVLGKVGNYNHRERGTTYHLHFDMQVPTKLGWVFVNPYMSLIAAYERLIGARGTEIKEGDPAPAMAGVQPVIMRPSVFPPVTMALTVHTEQHSALPIKLQKAKDKAKKKDKTKNKKSSVKKKQRRSRAVLRVVSASSLIRMPLCRESPARQILP